MRKPNYDVLTSLADTGICTTARYYYVLAEVSAFPNYVCIERYSRRNYPSHALDSYDCLVVRRSFLLAYQHAPIYPGSLFFPEL